MGEVNLDEFFCPNEACQDYGKKGKGNISAQLRSCGSGVGGVEQMVERNAARSSASPILHLTPSF